MAEGDAQQLGGVILPLTVTVKVPSAVLFAAFTGLATLVYGSCGMCAMLVIGLTYMFWKQYSLPRSPEKVTVEGSLDSAAAVAGQV